MSFEIFPWGAMRRHSGVRNVEQSLRDIKDCGFTASCFLEPKDVPLCRSLGLDPISFLFTDRPAPAGTSEFRESTEGKLNATVLAYDKSMTREIIEAEIKAALAQLDEGHCKVYLVDEPGAESYQRIRYMADTVKKYRPDLDLYVNLFPNYAMCGKPEMSQLEADTYEKYLDRYGAMFPDIPLSVDNYQIIMGMDNQNPKSEHSYYLNLIQCREVCEKYGMPLHYVVNSNQLRTFLTLPTMSNLMLQAFTVLAAGARSLAWFTYFGRADYCYSPVDDNGSEDIRTPVWYLLREVNRRALSMGNELFKMQYKGMFFKDAMGLPRAKSIEECERIRSFTADKNCLVGLYEDEGDPVVVVVNMSLEHSTTFDISLGEGTLLWWSTEHNKYTEPLTKTGGLAPGATSASSPMWLAPGDAAILRLKK